MSKYLNTIIHLIIASGILAIPTLVIILSSGQFEFSNTINYLLSNLVNYSVYISLFALAVPRLLMKGKNVFFYIASLALILFAAFIKLGLLYWIQKDIPGQIFTVTIGTNLGNQIIFMILTSFFFAVLGAFLRFTVDWFKNRQKMLKLELELKTSELAMLKYQMYPHFLFNTLNNIYALSKKSDPKASESMAKLSDILRYILYQSEEGMVDLNDDLEILKSFIDLELLRKEDPAFLSWSQIGNPVNHKIPPMLLLPLVENAFKHGDGIKLPVIEVICRIEHDKLCFTVKNAKSMASNSRIEASGIGLANIRKRLALTYPGKSELVIEDTKDSYSASINISLPKL